MAYHVQTPLGRAVLGILGGNTSSVAFDFSFFLAAPEKMNMAKANINALPPELIISIIRTVHLTDINTFLSCLRVNRTWYSFARELLYTNVVLTPDTIKRFCKRFRSSVDGHLVRSVTINLPSDESDRRIADIQPWRYEKASDSEADSEDSSDEDEDDEDDDEGQEDESDSNGNDNNINEKAGFKEDLDNESEYLSDRDDDYEEYPHYFRFLTRLLPRLPRLLSFSFLIPECCDDHSISCDQFIQLINALPECCTSLEVDIEYWSDDRTRRNVCPAIRQILPRMEHVRILLRNMCSELFLERETPSDDTGNNGPAIFKPVSLPKLKTLLIYRGQENCFPDKDDPVLQSMPQPVQANCNAVWHGVANALQQLVENRDQSLLSRSAKVSVMDLTMLHGMEHRTYFCADMMLQTTAVIPRLCLDAADEKRTSLYILRTLDGRELCGENRQLESLAEFLEGEVWRTAVGAARLPAALVNSQNSFAGNCVINALDITTLEEWRESHGLDWTCDLWEEEEKAGTWLVCAEERSGVEKYLSREPLDAKWKTGYCKLRRL